ncbi:MAG: dephospho-CoA kinase [Bacteroidota bacterium]
MKKIGITGSIGSGKSTVTTIFAALGIPVYDADSRAKTLMISNPTLIQEIKQLFGPDAYRATGELNRQHIASIAFHETSVLSQLNALVHPAVFHDFDEWCSQQTTHYVLKEAALMFESDSYKQLDEVIVVTAPEELRIIRTMNRDNITRDAVLSRMKNQLSQEEKLSRGQYEIRNNEQELLIPQVVSLHQQFIKA